MFSSSTGPPLCIGTTLHILRASGNSPDEKELLIILHKGKIIKSGISLRRLTGILCGPEDLVSNWFIISITSSLEMCVIKNSTSFLFFKYFSGWITGLWGIVFSVLGPMLTKKLFKVEAISFGSSIDFSSTFSWLIGLLLELLKLIIDLIPSQTFLLFFLLSSKYLE